MSSEETNSKGYEQLQNSVAQMAKIRTTSAPSFSQDASRVAFISDITGVPQVWTVGSDGGWPELLTNLDDQVTDVRWSPTGEWIAFLVAPGGGMNAQVYLVRPDGSDFHRVTAGGKDNNLLGHWTADGRKLAISSSLDNPASMDAYLYDVETGQLNLVVKNAGVGILTDVSRDGEWGVLHRSESRSNENLFLVNLNNQQESLLTPHTGPGSFYSGSFAPDGKTIYLQTNQNRDLVALGRVSLNENHEPGEIEVIAVRPDAELQEFVLTDDGKTAALIWNVSGRNELDFLDLATLQITPAPKLPAGIIYPGQVSFSHDGSRLLMTLMGATSPATIWIFNRSNGEFTQVTHSSHPGIKLENLVQPELVKFQSFDGLELSGWLYRPKNFTAPGPMVLSFHGGPEGQERPAFQVTYQALLAQGIGVFAPNVRGSSGFGKKFVNLDNGPLRFNGIKDIKACVDYVVNNKLADSKRIGIMGGSYGGYMTMAGLTEYPDTFAAGANSFGIVNFATFFAHTEPWMAAVSTIKYGDPTTQADLLRELSPIYKLDRVKGATLVLHGANDTNVPVIEAEQVVEELKKRNVPVEYVLFPDEGHGFRKTANKIRATVAIVEWFKKYL